MLLIVGLWLLKMVKKIAFIGKDPGKREWNYDREVVLAKENESYHRKQMEHYQEKINLMEGKVNEKSRLTDWNNKYIAKPVIINFRKTDGTLAKFKGTKIIRRKK